MPEYKLCTSEVENQVLRDSDTVSNASYDAPAEHLVVHTQKAFH